MERLGAIWKGAIEVKQRDKREDEHGGGYGRKERRMRSAGGEEGRHDSKKKCDYTF